MSELPDNIILFDGVCNFCNSSINKIIEHDKKNRYKFAPLQSEIGKKILQKYSIDTSKTDSIILIENGNVFIKSTASLKVSKHLSGLYPLAYGLFIFPAFIRDIVYDFIARNRYKWWGKKETCMIPSEEIKAKFI